MPLAIDPGDPPPLALDALADALADLRFDAADPASHVAAAPILAGLARNRHFLGDLLIAELATRARAQERDGGYGAQVVMLGRGEGWFARANIWPAADDPLLRRNGPARFFYGIPHDHNFSFLTIGYLGPGYWSDYYEHDGGLAGVPGEPAGLRFVERARLAEGRMLLYRAHRDVHSQYPADATSVSLNIVQGGGGIAFTDQYRFDVARDEVAAQIAHSASEALLALLPALGGGAGAELLADFAARHPCDRIRLAAIAAQAGAADGLDARAAVLARATRDASATVAALARQRLDALEAGRRWLG